ncbi:molybdate ABC transporter substrate-binding protein [Leisingera sp. ANG-Vp]|uniref:molybdate ABC transporter substrate-binding protein n=1 Tax=Leisingera sp. ANG-Vp TaxID=1577896 RepID=UPI00069176B8|nr:molybdate ABC transporter substrate-binding protein [Leisingera sp. ANG-Vp]
MNTHRALASFLQSLARWRLWLAAAALAAGLTLPAGAQVTVFAASSTKTALDEAAARFEGISGEAVTLSYAGSPALARQIQLGAPADVFISANPGWMDVLQQEGLVDPSSRVNLLENRLVLVAYGSDTAQLDLAEADLAGLLGGGKLAMALVDAVPAGIYGKAALSELGHWPAVAPHVAQAANVRAALALVATGEAPLGVVFATDASASSDVSVAAVFPEESHPQIIYPAAAVLNGNSETARAFLAYLRSSEARDIFRRHGFGVPEQ